MHVPLIVATIDHDLSLPTSANEVFAHYIVNEMPVRVRWLCFRSGKAPLLVLD